MQKGPKHAQSAQGKSSEHPHTPRMPSNQTRPSASFRSLRKLPSYSSPVSFQRLLQVKFQPLGVPSQANDSSESDTNAESDSAEPAAKPLLKKGDTGMTSGTMSRPVFATAFSSVPPILQARDPTTDFEDIISTRSQAEASIRLAAAGARKKVVHAEHRLALCIAQEHAIMGQLYEELANQVGRQAMTTDRRVDQVRYSIQERGFELAPPSPIPHSVQSPTKKRKSFV